MENKIDCTQNSKKKHSPRYWIPFAILALLICAGYFPVLPLISGLFLLILCLLVPVPFVNSFPRKMLRFNPDKPIWTGIKIAGFGMVAILLMFSAAIGFSTRAALREQRQRANAKVSSLVEQARKRYRKGNLQEAQEKLGSALKVEGATDLEPARSLLRQVREKVDAVQKAKQEKLEEKANSKVAGLVGEARQSLKAGDIDAAGEKLELALKTKNATKLQPARNLRRKIRHARDPSFIRKALQGLDREELDAFQKGNLTPRVLQFGYTVLNQQGTELALSLVAEVKRENKERRNKEHRKKLSETLNKTMQIPAGSFEWRKATLFVSGCRRQGDMPEVTDANCDVGILPGTFRVLQILDADKMLLSHLDSHGFADKTILVSGLQTNGLADGQKISVPRLATYEGTVKYENVLGAQRTVRHYKLGIGSRFLNAAVQRVGNLKRKIRQAEQVPVDEYVEAEKTLRMYKPMAERNNAAAKRKVNECREKMHAIGPLTQQYIATYQEKMGALEKELEKARYARNLLKRVE
ncbi:MAG: hypothetical protein ACLFWL_18200 [Candidatus Brocadiia bacterium]